MARAENQEQLIKRIRQLEDENSNLKEKLDDYIGRCGNFFSFVDGTPITRPSRSCRLCYRIIRSTVRGGGGRNSYRSDAVIGQYSATGPTVKD